MLPTSCLVNKDKDMPNYNTQGITGSAGSDPRNLGGSEGYGNSTASTSSGIMSSTANATTNNDDNDDEPGFFESIANLFSGAGADLPSGGSSDDDGDSGISFYDSPMFAPYDGGSDNDTAAPSGLPFETTAADRALYEALGVDVPEVYKGKMPEEEPEPNFDMDVLQKALQPDPITVEELEVKAGDTLTAIAEEKGVPVQAVIDANPQIKNPDLIRPGEVVSLPAAQAEIGQARASIMPAQQEIGQARAAIIMKGIDKLFGMFPPKTEEEKAAKSELEYFLDAQPDSALPDFFKYIPDAVQVQEYLKGRADRKMEGLARESAELSASERDAAGITRSLTPEEVDARNNVAGTDPRELGGAEGYGSVGAPADAETGEGLMTRPKARPEGLAEKTAAITAAKVRKNKLIDSVFKAEGGYSTDKDDQGNYYNGKFVGTNHGISAPALAKELGREPTVADMKALTKTKAKQIAGEQYFDRFAIDKLPEEVQEIVLHATYMGETRGVRAMQNLLGLTPDGVMGRNTRIAMENANFTKEEYKDEYLRELQFGTVGYSNPSATWNKHGKGWTNRYTKLSK
jgi:LysM repeat protein